ncbi:acylphosphatase [Ketobacter sp. MCCC 1A13808]|uniref:acylphosphatase n=1 Tax=Ketobacter sp. MCCC 1A13808 TaxID=2602738 RepID=UPI000F164D31|nr:acylphosphatase [Ketobacter sp. MCCC 1A13808]MVF10857.1 acylphosphatase [Ketobacter sp. MCCC 1A13808]RLP56255.1 MAG: acylphosphatase [Ketobacter sp.]
MPDLKRVHAIVHGRVQGVYYRASTKDKALSLHLTGWVRNMADGNVEFEAQGSAGNVDALVAWALLGPPDAIVNKVDTGPLSPIPTESHFEITY